eukprot:IDg18548t1
MFQSSNNDSNISDEGNARLSRSPKKARTDDTDSITPVEFSYDSRRRTGRGFKIQLVEVEETTRLQNKLARLYLDGSFPFLS